MRNLIRRSAVLTGAVALLLGSGTGVAAAAPGTAVLVFTSPEHGSHIDHHYGRVTLGETASQTFTVQNTGDRNNGGVHVTLTGSAEFSIPAGGSTCKGNLHPGESCTVTVVFAPTSEGTVHAGLAVRGNPHSTEATAGLTGTGTAPCVENERTGVSYPDLQDAVTAAEKGDTLLVTGTCTGTTRIGKNLDITGHNGAALNGEEQGSVLTVEIGVSVTLDALTITNGSAHLGGGIYNVHGRVTLNGSTVTDNHTLDAHGNGGGIYNDHGRVTLNGSTITENTAGLGGGIINFGTVTLNGASTVTANHTLDAQGNGGGINNQPSGTVTLNGASTVTENSSAFGGGIINYGTVTMNGSSSVIGNSATLEGGGIWTSSCALLHNAVPGPEGNVRGNTAPDGPDIFPSTCG